MSNAIEVTVSNPPRGGTREPLVFAAQSITATFAWGSGPASAAIDYVSNAQISAAPLSVGDAVRIASGGHLFYGICQSDAPSVAASGNVRTLQFVDLRKFLEVDTVFAAFNMADVRIVGNRRYKRYWHILPADWTTYTKTYTPGPLLAYEILDYIFSAPTVRTGWLRIYNGLLNYPVYSIDCLGGQTLTAITTDISQKLGTVFAQVSSDSTPARLVWIRKGDGAIPSFPANSDNRRLGVALSGNPGRVRIVGDRNLYQLEVVLQRDWAPAWEAFADFDVFADDVFNRGVDENGVRFDAQAGDTDQLRGRFKALARAKTMTVKEYAALRNDASFLDYRKFTGRSRVNMPVALYLSTLLYRAFRPVARTFTNHYGATVSLSSTEITSRMLAQVSHSVNAGTFVFDQDSGQYIPAEGNGYAIARGYQVGQDLFRTINPKQFNVSDWTTANTLWQHIGFQIDDSGENENFLIFDEPVIISPNLLISVDGNMVVNANFTISVPSVKAMLTVAAEKYFYPNNAAGFLGSGFTDGVENVSQLSGEYLVTGNSPVEIPYADGLSSDFKANEFAVALLSRQEVYVEGGYTVKGSNGTQLSETTDRVTYKAGPNGISEDVDFTNERDRAVFEPERELDRRTVQNSQFPGQEQLKEEARQAEAVAEGMKQSPAFVKRLQQLLSGETGAVGSHEPTHVIRVNDPQIGVLDAGTPLWRQSTSQLATDPGRMTSSNAGDVFMGVTVRDAENPSRPVRVQSSGRALARVQGPVEVGDQLGRLVTTDPNIPWKDYLIKGGTPKVAVARQKIATAEVALIEVSLGTFGGAAGEYALTDDRNSDYFVCRRIMFVDSQEVIGDEDIFIAKPGQLRVTDFDQEEIDLKIEFLSGGLVATEDRTETFTYHSATLRTWQDITGGNPGESELQAVTPPLIAVEMDGSGFAQNAGWTRISAIEVPNLNVTGPSNEKLTLQAVNEWSWAQV